VLGRNVSEEGVPVFRAEGEKYLVFVYCRQAYRGGIRTLTVRQCDIKKGPHFNFSCIRGKQFCGQDAEDQIRDTIQECVDKFYTKVKEATG
jgi:hypothetical protein